MTASALSCVSVSAAAHAASVSGTLPEVPEVLITPNVPGVYLYNLTAADSAAWVVADSAALRFYGSLDPIDVTATVAQDIPTEFELGFSGDPSVATSVDLGDGRITHPGSLFPSTDTTEVSTDLQNVAWDAPSGGGVVVRYLKVAVRDAGGRVTVVVRQVNVTPIAEPVGVEPLTPGGTFVFSPGTVGGGLGFGYTTQDLGRQVPWFIQFYLEDGTLWKSDSNTGSYGLAGVDTSPAGGSQNFRIVFGRGTVQNPTRLGEVTEFVELLPCPAGTAPTAFSFECVVAPRGTFVEAGSSTIEPCPEGTYQPMRGSVECIEAPAGTAVPVTVGDANELCRVTVTGDDLGCTVIQVGSFGITTGATASIVCPRGTYSELARSTSCTPADPGSYVPVDGSTEQTLCDPGSFAASAGSASCALAPEGFYVPIEGAASALACDPGTFQPTTGSIACEPAAPGYFAEGPGASTEELCVAGTYSPGGQPACTPAESGRFVAFDGAAAPELCPAGTYQPASGAIECLPAEPGTFVDRVGSAHALPCDVGRYQPDVGQVSCLPAPAGTFVSDRGQSEFQLCPAGRVAPDLGSLSCTPVQPGFIAPNRSTFRRPIETRSCPGVGRCRRTLSAVLTCRPRLDR